MFPACVIPESVYIAGAGRIRYTGLLNSVRAHPVDSTPRM